VQALRLSVQFVYLFAPLLLAAAISGLVLRYDWFAALRKPIDAGLSYRGRRLFGDSKTWRGVFVAVVGCSVGAAIQKYLLVDVARSIALVAYERLNVVAFGLAMGCGAMLGELPNSFVKRRVGIAPGKTTSGPLAFVFYVWDQLDLLCFSWPLLRPWIVPDLRLVLTSVAVTLALHPLSSLIGYVIGARKTAR
jgi:hypothetical protein